jgi:hypothetical protein
MVAAATGTMPAPHSRDLKIFVLFYRVEPNRYGMPPDIGTPVAPVSVPDLAMQ